MSSYHGTVNKFLFLKYSGRSVNAEIQSGDTCVAEEKGKKCNSSIKDLKAAGVKRGM